MKLKRLNMKNVQKTCWPLFMYVPALVFYVQMAGEYVVDMKASFSGLTNPEKCSPSEVIT